MHWFIALNIIDKKLLFAYGLFHSFQDKGVIVYSLYDTSFSSLTDLISVPKTFWEKAQGMMGTDAWAGRMAKRPSG